MQYMQVIIKWHYGAAEFAVKMLYAAVLLLATLVVSNLQLKLRWHFQIASYRKCAAMASFMFMIQSHGGAECPASHEEIPTLWDDDTFNCFMFWQGQQLSF